MVAALKAYPSLQHDDNLGGWLFTIAHHKVVDAARANGRRPVLMARVPDRASKATAEPGGDGTVWSEVDALPDKQRRAVLMRYLADRPYAEIAGALTCSEAAARQNVRAGLRRLRAR